MSFPIEFMHNHSPKNKLEKHTTTVLTVTGDLRDECSVTAPEFLVEAEDLTRANYAWIGPFRRFYFITDISAYRNVVRDGVMHRIWLVKMKCDVLMSFCDGILDSPCIIAKTAGNDFNLYLPDPNYKCQQNDRIGMVPFPNGFDLANTYFYLTFFG